MTVTRVFPNGNMEVAGQKEITLNNGNEYVRVKGIVRPEDISATNIVSSTRLADANPIQGLGIWQMPLSPDG